MESQKPEVPKKVCIDGLIYCTIYDYFYVAPGSELSLLFKTGWIPKYKYNFEHPQFKKELENFHRQQQQVLDRQKVDWEHLSSFTITI